MHERRGGIATRGASEIGEEVAVSLERRVAQMESIICDWLSDPSIAIVCGDWQSGSTMEILPEGRAVLTPPKYPEPFSARLEVVLLTDEMNVAQSVWFLVDEDCGNPYRKNAYFSATLKRPYTAAGAVKRDIVEQVFQLYRAFEHAPNVTAEPTFLHAMDHPAFMEQLSSEER